MGVPGDLHHSGGRQQSELLAAHELSPYLRLHGYFAQMARVFQPSLRPLLIVRLAMPLKGINNNSKSCVALPLDSCASLPGIAEPRSQPVIIRGALKAKASTKVNSSS